MNMFKRTKVIVHSLSVIFALSALPSHAAELPNAHILRKVSDTRYNLSINLLDQYANQQIGIRIRRVTGSVSEIIALPDQVVGAEGKTTIPVKMKLQQDDVFLFTFQKLVIYKIAFKDAVVVDINNPGTPEEPAPVVSESETPTSSTSPLASSTAKPIEQTVDRANLPNNVALRAGSNGSKVMTMNLIDIYVGQEISIDLIRTVKGVSQTLSIGKTILGAEGKSTVTFKGNVKRGDLFVMRLGTLALFSYAAKTNLP